MSFKNEKKAILICGVILILFASLSLVFNILMTREMEYASKPLTWATSTNKLFADNFKILSFVMVGIFIYLQVALKVKSYVRRIDKLERDVEELKNVTKESNYS